jgi:hypothetical protein
VDTCAEVANALNIVLNIFFKRLKEKNIPLPDFGSGYNIDSSYCVIPFITQQIFHVTLNTIFWRTFHSSNCLDDELNAI